MKCFRCRGSDLGWSPPPSSQGRALCTTCSDTGWTPDPPEPDTWRNWAIGVDITPWAEKIQSTGEQRWADEERIQAGKPYQSSASPSVLANRKEAILVEVCGAVAVSAILGARIADREARHDIVCRSGLELRVKTVARGWPYERWAPNFTIGKRERRADCPHVLVVTRRPPDCYRMVWIVGMIDHRKIESIRNEWRFPFFTAAPWERFEPLMQDELNRPYSPLGAVLRTSEIDPGYATPANTRDDQQGCEASA